MSNVIIILFKVNTFLTIYACVPQIYSGHLSWMFPKHTPYTDRISEVVVRLREAGIVDKLFADHFNPGKVAKEDVSANLKLY